MPRVSSACWCSTFKAALTFLISPAMTPPAHCASIINLSHAKGIWPLVASLEEAMQQGLRTTNKNKHHVKLLNYVSTSTTPVAARPWSKNNVPTYRHTADLVANYPVVNAKRKHLKFSHLCETWEVFAYQVSQRSRCRWVVQMKAGII